MRSYGMKSARLHTKGFTLIASLLLLMLLSGIAIGLMMMVNTEGKVGGSDLQNNASFHSAEGGIEKMTSDLASVFKSAQSPNVGQICGVGGPAFGGSAANEPAIAGITWKEYQVTPGALGVACPTQAQFNLLYNWGNVQSGPNQGLYAQIIPVNMLATADFPGGQEVSMIRNAQVALIPVFQFGVFSESDLSFFPGPAMDFAGPVHTNGDLYLAGQATVTFHNQLSAYGNVVRTVLANGNSTASNGYTGTIYIPTANATNACSTTTTSCKAMDAPTASSYGDASVTGGGSTSAQPLSTYNGSNAWYTFSKNTTSHEIINGNFGSTVTNDTGTGAVQLSMPFVNGTTHPYEIIRRPSTGEAATSALGQSREYNLAQIHVLLSDDPADLPGGASDTNNVRLANVTQAMVTANSAWTKSNPYGISIATANTTLGAPSSGSYTLYFAAASNAFPDTTNCTGTYCPSNSAKATALSSDWPYFPKTWTPPASQALDSNCTLLCPTGAPLSPLSGAQPGSSLSIQPCPPAAVAAANLPAGCPAVPAFPYYNVGGATITTNAQAIGAGTISWNVIDGWLRVEYLNNSNQWVPITNEWLQLGFARGVTPPTAPGPSTNPGSNPINPNAILLLQEPADRNGDGVADRAGLAPSCTLTSHGVCTQWSNALPPEVQPDTTTNSPYFGLSTAATQSISMYNWYPINFYDAREGENRDNILAAADDSCTTNGVMNAVEIDVGNLKRWLANTSGSGPSVNFLAQNGYVLYFSDRRGMLYNPHPPLGGAAAKAGDSGLEDVINAASANGTPDGGLETPGGVNSPEDVNQNGFLDNFGPLNLGLGFWNSAAQNLNTAINTPANPDPFGTAAGSARITSCNSTARKNWVSGARHVLRLVDGSLGNVPLRTDAAATLDSPGGFTVASENPVYILGDYNSNTADSAGWAGDTTAFAGDVAGHAAAAVIADTVTLLSHDWTDAESMQTGNVTNANNRNANTVTSYRVAISGGKNRTFPYSSASTWAVYAGEPDIGTDGGVHNFLRFLEDWNVAANYKGSLVSLYYSTYNTGFYKCCNTVYDPPTRNYFFDLDFTSPGGLPPGTPMFRDVESLSFRQLFTTRTSSN
jgi:hypothetical protein